MPTLAWTAADRPQHGTAVHVFASRFETRTLWGALKFLARTPGVWRQVRDAPGTYGAALKAEPFKRTFWTLSTWESPEALKDFARSGVHAPASRRLSTEMRDAKFASWTASGDEPPVSWAEVRRRLA
jgi:heme-degrading monooxygenase HmoA